MLHQAGQALTAYHMPCLRIARALCCAGRWGLGVFFHFAGDVQKHTALQAKRGHLVTDGLWSLSRNINIFGSEQPR